MPTSLTDPAAHPAAVRPTPDRPPGRTGRRAVRLAFLVVTVVVFAPGFARGDEPGTTDDKLIAKRLEWHVRAAQQEIAEWEAAIVGSPEGRDGGPTVGNFQQPDALLKYLRAALDQTYGDLRQRTDALAARVRERRAAVETDWRTAYRARIEFQRFADARQAAYGFDFKANRAAPFRASVLDIGLLVVAAILFLTSWQLAAFATRVPRRRAARGRRFAAGALAGVVAAAALAQSGCDATKEAGGAWWAVREDAWLTAEIDAATTAAKAAQDDADGKWNKAVEAWGRMLAAKGAATQAEDAFRQGEADARARLQKINLDAVVADRLAREVEADRAKLPDDRKRLGELQSTSQFRAYAFNIGRVVLAAGLAVVAVAPLRLAARRVRKQVAAQSQECPRCQAVGKLAARAVEVQDDRYPEPEYVECQVCSYRFRKSYLRLPRVCFPAVGGRSCGKTHMLVTAYDRIRNGSAPTDAVIQRAPSLGDDLFEQYIDLVLRQQGQAGATVHALPEPIILHMRDTDRRGSNTVLVNLFDFSGEMMDARLDTDLLRRRAVMNDGFMMLLDPTQLYGEGSNLRLEDQIRAMQSYYEDMREQRKMDVGEAIPVPVAVCISKFDLLVSDNPIRMQAVPFIQKIMKSNDMGAPVTLAALAARSAVVEQMLPLIFPGVDLRRILRGYFGGRVMFFPMSSVSLYENELGIKDMKRRTMAPFGVVEPLLWLMHMHGYEMLG